MSIEIHVFRGDAADGQYSLERDQALLVGRNPDSDIRLFDLSASRKHLTITCDDGELWVEDLGSSLGSWLDGERFAGRRRAALPCVVQIGRYRLELCEAGKRVVKVWEEFSKERLLGEGGFGRVYAAHRRGDSWPVAIKEIDLAADAQLRERFLREARLCTQIDHPNVVRIHEVRVEGEAAFQIMERVPDAEDLVDCLVRGPMPAGEALRVGEGVARGLHALHLRGIVHRDIKPANILVTPDGAIKITDFGLARGLESGDTLTESLVGLGTITYVSPEQAMNARDAKPAADLYSLGATLYHLIAGEPALIGDTVQELLASLAAAEPTPIRELAPDCPADVAEVVHRLLHKDPFGRFEDAAAAADAMAALR